VVTNTKQFEALRSKFYRIGQEERFKTRIEQIWEYCDRVSTYKRETYFMWGGIKMQLEITKDKWHTSSKGERMTMGKRSKKGSKSYYYIRLFECVGEDWERVLCVRVDNRGTKSEMPWLGRGKKVSGKAVSRMANSIYKALRPRSNFVHDDAHLEFRYAGGDKADKQRSKIRKVAKDKRKARISKKKMAQKSCRRNKRLRKTQQVQLRYVRILTKGLGWYESMGFAPLKRSGHKFAKDKGVTYSQHPAQYRAAAERFRSITIKEIHAMFTKSSSTGRSQLGDNALEICKELGNPRADTTLSTLCKRMITNIKRKPKSLKAQRLVTKFNSTFFHDHEDRFDDPGPRLKKYYNDLNVLELTMLFKKRKDEL